MQITLTELLEAREERAERQSELIGRHRVPLVCFTMNIAGPTKTSPLIERAFSVGVALIKDALAECEVLEVREEHSKCGPVLYYSVRCDAWLIKSRLTSIEDTHPIGRLFDMDVLGTDGKKLERANERGCLVCGAPGRACAAGRLHPTEELVAQTNRMLTDYFLDLDSRRIAALAAECLTDEVYTTPKPGLVDRENCGSHTDMGIYEFEQSAGALTHYFADCVKIGYDCSSDAPVSAFADLRRRGILAEGEMYVATGGVNTHKGIIFSLGIICCAIGRLMRPEGTVPDTDAILTEATRLSSETLRADLDRADRRTAGGRAYLELGEKGIRGEVIDGFPALRRVAIPAYRAALGEGKSKNDAGVTALLHLIANIYDTSIYNRGGDEGVTYARELAYAAIEAGATPDAARKMDAALTERNLSPGGCADLLAITYFLTELEDSGLRPCPK